MVKSVTFLQKNEKMAFLKQFKKSGKIMCLKAW